ncbi:pinin [Selaginella moellendorffii]|uniref:pinin n=1 Tax=Selaginella moellendorffii TaxID=88036 RepID=UPI000D1CDDFC|nr:pinin [Selaginella moellendorffii]|eukprot:XP_024530794.1 pinin [Selaginella moellendorffii]
MASAAVDKTVDELRHEIAELYRQNREINERLNNPRGRRLGRGGFSRAVGGRGGGRGGRTRKADGDLEGPPTKRLHSVVKVNGDSVEAHTKETGTSSPRGRRREPFLTGQAQEFRTEPVPKTVSKVDDPKLAKRNRRMFGALLGTLEKFRKEEMSNSESVMRRSDSLKRAVQKAQEESDKLRQEEREHLTERRKRDLMLRAKISAKAEEKQIELLYMQWTAHQSKVSSFLKTKAEPGIHYLPVKQTERDKHQLEEQRKAFEEWKVKCREELDEYQKQITETFLAKAQADIDRVVAARNRKRIQFEGGDKELEEEAAGGNLGEQIDNENEELQDEQGQEEEVADVMEEEDYRPEDDTTLPEGKSS